MRDSKAEFQFIDFARHKATPGAEKAPSEPVHSNLRAMRPVAYGLLAFWIATYAVIAYLAGWFDRWLS